LLTLHGWGTWLHWLMNTTTGCCQSGCPCQVRCWSPLVPAASFRRHPLLCLSLVLSRSHSLPKRFAFPLGALTTGALQRAAASSYCGIAGHMYVCMFLSAVFCLPVFFARVFTVQQHSSLTHVCLPSCRSSVLDASVHAVPYTAGRCRKHRKK